MSEKPYLVRLNLWLFGKTYAPMWLIRSIDRVYWGKFQSVRNIKQIRREINRDTPTTIRTLWIAWKGGLTDRDIQYLTRLYHGDSQSDPNPG